MYKDWIVQHVIKTIYSIHGLDSTCTTRLSIMYMDWINLLFETCLGYNMCDVSEILLSKHNGSIVLLELMTKTTEILYKLYVNCS